MADDRLYFRCTGCKQAICLAKTYGGEPAVRNENLADDLDVFIDWHLKDCPDLEWDWRGFFHKPFDLVSETQEGVTVWQGIPTPTKPKEATMLRPLYDRVLVKRDEAPDVSEGGIVLPDKAKEPMTRGEVLAVGAGHQNDDGSLTPCVVQVGDVVMFGKYAGTDVRDDEEDYVILNEGDILATLGD